MNVHVAKFAENKNACFVIIPESVCYMLSQWLINALSIACLLIDASERQKLDIFIYSTHIHVEVKYWNNISSLLWVSIIWNHSE